MADQAAGLRNWAETQAIETQEPPIETQKHQTPSRVLMVLGLPDGAESEVTPVIEALQRWHDQGQGWVADPASWRVVALDADSPHLSSLATHQGRWALWVENDLNGFRRAYLTLKSLVQRKGPNCLLLVHPPLPSRKGLLGNLQQAAAQFLGIKLLVIDPPRRRHAKP